MNWFKVEKTRFQSAEHTQTDPPPYMYTWFHVGFLDPQFPGSMIHEAAKATNRVFLADGLVYGRENPISMRRTYTDPSPLYLVPCWLSGSTVPRIRDPWSAKVMNRVFLADGLV